MRIGGMDNQNVGVVKRHIRSTKYNGVVPPWTGSGEGLRTLAVRWGRRRLTAG